MAIINLQTNLKSLTYGGEKPYITKSINNPPSSNRTAIQVNRRIDDVSRITQMLADKPGVKYLINNTLLHGSRLEHKLNDEKNKVDPTTPSKIVLGELKSAGLDTLATIGSTLAQVAINGTGTHFIKGFGAGISSYIGDKDAGSLAYYGSPINIPSNQPSTLVSGQGGDLKIARKSQSAVYQSYDSDSIERTQYGQFDISNNDYYDGSTYNNTKRISLTVNGSIRKETRVNLGDQGARKDPDKTANNYWKASVGAKDSINALPVQIDSKVDGNTEGRDLVKFRFHVVTPEHEYILYFRAYLESFTDNYNGTWNENKYLGRGESFYTYGGFQRKISLSFKIAAATREEMMPLYRKMIYLASSTAPTYGNNGQFMRGTFSKITVGDYVYELPGVMNSVTYAWNSDYPWEIAMTEPEGLGDKTMQELPMVMDCNIEFTPIHTFTPTAGFNKYITTKGDTADTPGVLVPQTVDKDLPNPTLGDLTPTIVMGPQTEAQANASPYGFPTTAPA